MVDLKDLTQPEPRPGDKEGTEPAPKLQGVLEQPAAAPSGTEPGSEAKPDTETEPQSDGVSDVGTEGDGEAGLKPDLPEPPFADGEIPGAARLGLEFEPLVPPKPPKKTGLRLLIVFVGLIVVGGLSAWWFLGDRIEEAGSGDVPLIKADDGPAKVKPETPGGMDVPNKDKLVYNRMGPGDIQPKVERLLPPPEEPMEKPVATEEVTMPPAAPSADAPMPRSPRDEPAPAPEREIASTPVPSPKEVEAAAMPEQPAIAKALDEKLPEPKVDPIETSLPAEETSPAKETPAAEIAKAEPEPLPDAKPAPEAVKAVPETLPDSKPAPEVVEAAPEPGPVSKPEPRAAPESETILAPPPEAAPVIPQPAPAPPPIVDMSKAYKVQLAAVRTHPKAEGEYERLKKVAPDLLGALELDVMRADLGKKGVFYRVRVGPLANEAAARRLCKDLKARKVGCLVVRPGR